MVDSAEGGCLVAHPDFSQINTWVFDLDNTLYNPEHSFEHEQIELYVNYLARKGDTEPKVVRKRLEELSKTHFDPMARYVQLGYPFDINEWVQEAISVDYSRLPKCDRTAELIEKLPGKKYIFTNHLAQHAERVLQQLHLDHLFDGISDNVSRDYINKPESKVYTDLVQEFNFEPTKAVFVEDSPENLQPAFTMGMKTVLVHRTDIHEAEFIEHQYPTLLEFLEDVA